MGSARVGSLAADLEAAQQKLERYADASSRAKGVHINTERILYPVNALCECRVRDQLDDLLCEKQDKKGCMTPEEVFSLVSDFRPRSR